MTAEGEGEASNGCFDVVGEWCHGESLPGYGMLSELFFLLMGFLERGAVFKVNKYFIFFLWNQSRWEDEADFTQTGFIAFFSLVHFHFPFFSLLFIPSSGWLPKERLLIIRNIIVRLFAPLALWTA